MAKKFLSFKKKISIIDDIRQTLKVLEKISAADIHRLKLSITQMNAYQRLLLEILSDFPGRFASGRWFRKPASNKTLKILLTSQKGHWGGLLNRLLDFFQSGLEENDILAVMGEKGRALCQERGLKIDYFFAASDGVPLAADGKSLKALIVSEFLKGRCGRVLIFYPEFRTIVRQEPQVFRFLPINKKGILVNSNDKRRFDLAYPLYEPSAKKISRRLTEEYFATVLFQKILEAKLSELAARTMLMENGVEKSKKMLSSLSHQYFRTKREAITSQTRDLYSRRALKWQ
jgi:F-type H+-transporting ATPase subunit gamma